MLKRTTALTLLMLSSGVAQGAAETTLKPGDNAPLFEAKLHDGTDFSLSSRKGKGWTVLYFYPKADTPGCTKQACAFRDAIDNIQKLNANVYGISSDSVESQRKFHEKYKLKFSLMADPDASIINLYGAKMPVMKMAKRWTFVIDKELKIRWVERDVDPALDAQKVADAIKKLGG